MLFLATRSGVNTVLVIVLAHRVTLLCDNRSKKTSETFIGLMMSEKCQTLTTQTEDKIVTVLESCETEQK